MDVLGLLLWYNKGPIPLLGEGVGINQQGEIL
jgi:hypothetical protein